MPNIVQFPILSRSLLTFRAFTLCTTLLFMGISGISHAQNTSVSNALDSPANNFTSEFFRINTTEFTTGASSLEITTYPFNCCAVHSTVGTFGRDRTITFDYRYDRNVSVSEYVGIEVLSSNRLDIFDLIDLPPTNGQWCRRSFYITDENSVVPSPQIRVEWQTDKAPFSRSTLLFDNIQSAPGNNVSATRCVDDPEQFSKSAAFILPAVSLLLLDGDGGNNGGGGDPLNCGPANPTPTAGPGRFYGSISLPQGVVAPAGGVDVEVETVPLDFQFVNNVFLISDAEVTIPAGERAICYEIDLFEGTSLETKNLSFSCTRGCDNLNVATDGYWNDTVGATSFFSGTDYPVFQETPVNIELQQADVFKGEIVFPGGLDANGTEQFAISAEAVVNGFVLIPESFTTYVYPQENETSIPFLLGVRNNIPDLEGWILSVSCISCDADIVIAEMFVTAANGGVLSLMEIDAFEFESGNNHSNIQINLLETAP